MNAKSIAALAAPLLLSACAHTTVYEPQDPLEPVNRVVFKFNDVADRYVLRPVARGYVSITPKFVRSGVRNFFDNLFYPVTIINQYAQGEWVDGTKDIGRFVVNSTIGIGGLIDVAQYWGMPAHDEDFGQTLGAWGVGEGWYLMVPFLGPSTNRDFVGMLVGIPASPLYYYEDDEIVWTLGVLDKVQQRADLLPADALLNEQSDRYAFIRSAYLQQRQSAVRNGAPAPEDDFFDEFLDEDF